MSSASPIGRDRRGQKFGLLTIMGQRRTGKTTLARCRCECGGEIEADISNVTRGTTRSCGCLRYVRMDLTGRRYGALIVEGPEGEAPIGKAAEQLWRCLCNCGNRRVVRYGSLQKWVVSCGCLDGRRVPCDRVGLVLGRLTVIEQADSVPSRPRYRCRCECGREKITGSNHLQMGMTLSCGCLVAELNRLRGKDPAGYADLKRQIEAMREQAQAAWTSRTRWLHAANRASATD